MNEILVVGGGLAGCVAARELSQGGCAVLLLEKGDALGGNARKYGCKADEACNNCGVCLTGSVWDEVQNDTNIQVLYGAYLVDLTGQKGAYRAYVRMSGALKEFRVAAVVVASGFTHATQSTRNLEIIGGKSDRIISGAQLEAQFKLRTSEKLLDFAPKSVAFLLCFGSRDVKEKAQYCSRVCCSYSTRAAKTLKYYYPDCDIEFFFMDLQMVEHNECYKQELMQKGIAFTRCRPTRLRVSGDKVAVLYEGDDGLTQKQFDLVVIAGGIAPGEDNVSLSDICSLAINENGFMKYVKEPDYTGIALSGCASGPKNIQETVASAKNAARSLLNNFVKVV